MDKVKLLKLNNDKTNLIISPYSLLIALSMLRDGANGKTKEELDNIINNENINDINNIEQVLSILNKMYIKDTVNNTINENYKNTIKNKYKADIELNKLDDVDEINKYIEDNTFGQIKNMLKEIEGNLLLINTLAVDMEWPYKIDPIDVNDGEFLDMDASYIYGFYKSNASYYKNDDIIALGLKLKQYDDNIYECVLIQPDKISLDEYINELSDDMLNSILNNLQSLENDERKVDIAVPKFSFEYELDANSTFTKLGLNLTTPDLSLISDITDDINIHHKSNIDFSELGLKAASATIVEIFCGCGLFEQETLEIIINKPFIFVLREKNSNTILFLGTVYKPVLWKDDCKNYQYK